MISKKLAQLSLRSYFAYTNQVSFYFHHLRVFHCGAQTTLVTARKIYFNCIWCFKVKPRFVTQIIGNGVDFAGPFIVRHHARCKQPKKAYLALFICFTTKAIQIELLNDLSTDTFLRALRRFISDRSVSSRIFSDNGTNFRGAANFLAEVRGMLKKSSKDIRETCNDL